MSTALVFDTGALLAYARRSSVHVPRLLATASTQGHDIVVPVTCLAEAYAATTGEERLLIDALLQLGSVAVAPLAEQDARDVGVAAAQTGRLGLGHAVVEALREGVLLVTTDPVAAARALDEWQIWDLGSDHPPGAA